MRRLFRKAGLGRAAYYAWHWPVNRLVDSLRNGGPVRQWRTVRGRAEMEAAAARLPLLADASGRPLELHILTGRRFWYQTAFCLWTFARHTRRPLKPVIYDDGSLETRYSESLKRLFPHARIVTQAETLAMLEENLPAARFPVLRERWQNYPNIRKLLDVHAGKSGWKLVLDSDLLFFRRPDLLVNWLDAPHNPLHAVDCTTSYGYSRALMDDLAGNPVADLVNVGLTGLDSGSLEWDRIEHWCRVLIDREHAHYYLEQALVAMLVAGRPCTVAPRDEYVTLPVEPEARQCSAVMHHYVADSKRWYFQHCWRVALRG